MGGHIPELDEMLGQVSSLSIEECRPAVLDNLVEVVGDDLCSKAKAEIIFLTTMSFMN